MTMERSRDEAVGESYDATEGFDFWLRILELMAQLELIIEVHQHDRRAFELRAARERDAIERERELMQEARRRSWFARLRRQRSSTPRIIDIDEGRSSKPADDMGVAPRGVDMGKAPR